LHLVCSCRAPATPGASRRACGRGSMRVAKKTSSISSRIDASVPSLGALGGHASACTVDGRGCVARVTSAWGRPDRPAPPEFIRSSMLTSGILWGWNAVEWNGMLGEVVRGLTKPKPSRSRGGEAWPSPAPSRPLRGLWILLLIWSESLMCTGRCDRSLGALGSHCLGERYCPWGPRGRGGLTGRSSGGPR